MSYKCLAFAWQEDFLSNIVHLSNVGSMLGQRRRRWPNIKTPLDQCLVWVVSCNQFSGYINAVNLYSIGYCWPTLDRPRHARFEAEWFFKAFVSRIWHAVVFTQFGYADSKSAPCQALFCLFPTQNSKTKWPPKFVEMSQLYITAWLTMSTKTSFSV